MSLRSPDGGLNERDAAGNPLDRISPPTGLDPRLSRAKHQCLDQLMAVLEPGDRRQDTEPQADRCACLWQNPYGKTENRHEYRESPHRSSRIRQE